MDGRMIAGLLWQRRCAHQRDRWSPDRVARFQTARLARLRAFAARSSAFYREHHRSLQDAPLSALPPLPKATFVAHWDDLVTEPDLSRAGVQGYVAAENLGDDVGRPWQGRWWVAATAGTTGERAVFAWNRGEWTQVLASYARVNDWAGVRVTPTRPVRTAIVSTRNPAHQSAVVGASLNNPLVPTLRLDATRPLDSLIDELNTFRPRLLVCYTSMLGPLAEAQQSGALHITPERVVTASEAQLLTAREAALRAWGVDVVNTYAATEAATIASTCSRGSLHLYEDFVITESVDDAYRLVPDGELGTRTLVTVLFSRTLPLIRYELTDSIRPATGPCPCGNPFRKLEEVAGRTDETLDLPGLGGRVVNIRPEVFHDSIGPVAVHGWQVRSAEEGLVIRIVDPAEAVDTTHLLGRVRDSLASAGVADLPVIVDRVNDLERTRLGKAPLIGRG